MSSTLPVCGDEDGTETPFISGCPQFLSPSDRRYFLVPGSGTVQVLFDQVYREAALANELAVFVVDSTDGAVNGVLPGQSGWPAQVASRNPVVVFPLGSTASSPDAVLSFQAGDVLAFRFTSGGVATYSYEQANSRDTMIAYQHSSGAPWQFAWDDEGFGSPDGDMNDAVYVISANPSPVAPPTAAGNFGSTSSGPEPGGCDPAALKCRQHGTVSEPVDTATGNFLFAETDLSLAGATGVPFALTRSYNSLDALSGDMGPGWTFTYGARLLVQPNGDVIARAGDGQQLGFERQGDGSFVAEPGGRASLVLSSGTYTLTTRNLTAYRFDSSGTLLSVKDRNDRGVTLAYDPLGKLASATDAAGRVASFQYNSDHLLSGVAVGIGTPPTFGSPDNAVEDVTGANEKRVSRYRANATGTISQARMYLSGTGDVESISTTDSGDGSGYRAASTYAAVPGASYTVNDGTSVWASRSKKFSGDYTIDTGQLRFDTSGIPESATILSARLSLYVKSKDTNEGLDLLGDYYDFGGEPSVAADWTNNEESDAFEYALSAILMGQSNTIALSNLENIDTTGTTAIRLKVSKRAGNAAPTAGNEIEIASSEDTTHPAPKLQVTYLTTQDVRVVVYEDDASAPGALLASSAPLTLPSGLQAGWQTFTFPDPPALDSGSDYWIGLQWGSNPVIRAYKDSEASGTIGLSQSNSDTFTDGASDLFGTATASSSQLSLEVTVNPEPGTTAAFGSPHNLDLAGSDANVKSVSKYTANADGTISSGRLYLRGTNTSTTTQDLRMLIYSDSSGSPGSLLGSSEVRTLNATLTPGWQTFTFLSPPTVTSGMDYWIGLQWGSNAVIDAYEDSAASGAAGTERHNSDTFSDGPTSTFGSSTSGTAKRSLEVTVTTPAGATTAFGSTTNVELDGTTENVKSVSKYVATATGSISSGRLYLSGTGEQETFTAADADDGSGYKTATAYGSWGSFDDSDGAWMWAARGISGGEYYLDTSHVRFNTASIPDGATILSAQLKLYVIDRESDDDLSYVGDYYDFGGEPTVAGDWTAGEQSDAFSTPVAGLTDDAVNTINLSNLSNINKTGHTGIRLKLSQLPGDAAPTGDNAVRTAPSEDAVYAAPQLVVSYVTTPTTQDLRMLIYTNSGGSPGSLLGSSEVRALPSDLAPGWQSFTFPTPVNVTTGTSYWIGLHWGSNPVVNAYLDSAASTAGTEKYNSDTFSNGPTDPFGSSSSAAAQRALDVTVTRSSAGVTHVQSAGQAAPSETAATTIAQAFGSDVTAGSLIMVTVSVDANPSHTITVSDSLSNTYTLLERADDPTHNQAYAVFYAKNVNGGANTVTATFNGSRTWRRITVHEYAGADPTDPIDVHAVREAASGTTGTGAATAPTITTTGPGELIFAALDTTSDVIAITPASGYTQRQAVSEIVVADKLQATGGPVTPSFTLAAAGTYHAIAAAIRPAGTDAAASVSYGYTDGRLSSVSDPRGNTWTYAYDDSGKLTEITDPLGHTQVTNVYDPSSGRISSQTDAEGETTSFAWNAGTTTATITDANGNVWEDVYDGDLLVARTDGTDNTTEYTYDTDENVESVEAPDGETTTMTYDDDGNLLTAEAPASLSSATKTITVNANNDPTSITDARGNITAYTYDGNGNLLTITQDSVLVATYTYDAQGRKLTFEDGNGNTTTYTYDSATGNLASETNELDEETSYRHDGLGRLVARTDPRGNEAGCNCAALHTTTFSYDADGNLLASTDQLGHTTSNEYDDAGRLLSTTDANGNSTEYTHDDANRILTITAADGGVTEYTYDDAGNKLTETDPEEHTTTFAYDDANRLASKTAATGAETTFFYDENGNLAKRVEPRGNVGGAVDPDDFATTFTYDAAGRLLTETDPLGNVTTRAYDEVGNEISVTDANGNATVSTYDGLNRLETVTAADTGETTYTYDDAGNKLSETDPEGNTTTYAYDEANRLASVTRPEGGITTYAYDASGNRTSMVEPRGNVGGCSCAAQYTWTYTFDRANSLLSTQDPLGNITSSGYDAVGNRLSSTDANEHTTGYTYDEVNRVASITAPDGGVTTNTYDLAGNLTSREDAEEHTTTYAYDDDNRRTGLTNPLSKTWTWAYDEAGHVTSKTDANGNATGTAGDGTTTYTYNPAGWLTAVDYSDATPDVTFTHDDVGNRLSMVDGAGTQTRTYDEVNRLASVARGTDTFSYTYDLAGNLTKRTYPGSIDTDYTYDDDNRIATAVNDGLTTSYAYDAAGNLTTTTLPTANGHVETRVYDQAGRLTEVKNDKGGTTLSRFVSTLDPAGNPTQIERTGGLSETSTYSYDDNDRLTTVCFATSCTSGSPNLIEWTYDHVGNRLTETRSSGTVTSTYNAGDQLTAAGATNYTYDDNGNRLTGAGSTITWDLTDHLKTITQGATTTTYTYDGHGLRLQMPRSRLPR